MRNEILFVLFILSLTPTLQAETNYCHDEATNKQWEQIKHSHRGERDVEALAALRERLCRQVDAGKISVREATELFEAERERVIRERREYNRRQEIGGVGMG
jgi:predicted kinase